MRDPWAKLDDWRNHKIFTRSTRGMFPGLGLATVAFGIYLIAEQLGGDKKPKHDGGEHKKH